MKTMKRCVALALALLLATGLSGALAEKIKIDETHFPDPMFRVLLRGEDFDEDGDGYLSDAERNIDGIEASQMDIRDLKGIEFFPGIKELDLEGNKLTKLDLSKNTSLELLNCADNNLTSLILGRQSALELLCCEGNKGLKTLDIGGCPKLAKAVRKSFSGAWSTVATYGFNGDRPIVTCNVRLTLKSGNKTLRKYGKPKSVSFSRKSLKVKKGWEGYLEEKGTFINIGAKAYPCTYKSSNNKILKVDKYGLCKALKKGTATITVKCGKKTGKIKITVK